MSYPGYPPGGSGGSGGYPPQPPGPGGPGYPGVGGLGFGPPSGYPNQPQQVSEKVVSFFCVTFSA